MHTRLIVIVLTLLSLGIISLLKLPLNLLPGIEQPSLLVRIEWPGASAQEVERAISEPTEALLGTIPGLSSIQSFSRQELALIELNLLPEADRDMAFIRVREKLEVMRQQLPPSAKVPIVIRSTAADKPVAVYAIRHKKEASSLQSELALKNWVDQVMARRLEGIEGVAQAVLVGAAKAEWAIRFNPEQIERFGIRVEELQSLVANQNQFTASGLLRDSWYRYALKAETRIQKEEDLLELPIKRLKSGRIIRIKDIAELSLERAPAQSFALLQSQNIILLQVKKEYGRNTVQVVEALDPVIAQLHQAYPDIHIELLSEQASIIKSTIRDLLIALGGGGLLAFLVLFIFLKDPFLPFSIGLSIPLSLLISFFVMFLLDIDLNIVSLGGLTLGIGLLVDNSIVVLENMKRHKEMGKSLLQASKDGTKEIALAATASTLTTISVFVPLIYLGGVQGILFRDQALTLSISLLASLAVALFFLPSAAIAITGKRAIHADLFHQSRWLQRTIHAYENIVNQILKRKWISFVIVLGLLCLVYVLGSLLPKRIMPSTKNNQFSARVFLPTNAAIESTEQAARLLSDYLLAQDSTLTIQIHGGFSDQTNLQLLADEALNRFKITVKANDYSRIPQVKTLFIKYIQYQWNWTSEFLQEDEIYGSVLAFSSDVVLLSIENRSREGSTPIVEALEQRLKLIAPETKLIKKYPQTQTIIALTLKDEARRLYDISLSNLLKQIQTFDLGLEATQWQQGSEQISIRLKRSTQKMDLTSMPIFWNGQRFRLEQVMDIEEVQSPELFERDRQQAVETYVLNWSLSEWFAHKESLKQILAEPQFAAYSIFVKGLGTEVDTLLTDLSELILLSILLIYLLLAAQFESWIYPLFMVISVPLAWLGAFGLLVLLGLELSLFSGLGILVLTGIAVNDAILKIDFMKRYYQETGDVLQAISQAGQARFRPVIMTSITTILGLFPMLLPLGTNYELSQALAASVVGGMITSTLLTLIVMPLLFYLKEEKR